MVATAKLQRELKQVNAITKINKRFENWSGDWRLTFEPKKTGYLRLSNEKEITKNASIN